MNSEKGKEKNKKISREYKSLVKNSFYSFMHSYSAFLFSIITSFIMARIISQEVWSYLILSTAYTTLFTLILTFLPPSLALTFNYFVARFRSLNENAKLKSFIFNSMVLRSFFVFLTFIVSFIIFIVFSDLFKISLLNYYHILLIISPLIIINGLDKVLIAIDRALNMFNFVFYLLIIRYIFHIGGLLFIFLFFETIELSNIALIILISNLIPFVINCIFVFISVKYTIEKTNEKKLSIKETFKYLYSYGSPLSVKNFIDSLIKETRIVVIRFFESPEFITGYSIANNYKAVSAQTFQSLPDPLTISFTELYSKQKIGDIKKIYDTVFQFFIFIILLLTGLLIFVADFFLYIIYGVSYLKFSLLLKLATLSLIFNVIGIFFQALLRASNKVKYIIPVSLLVSSITFGFFLIGLVIFGIHGAVLGIFFGSMINFFIFIFVNLKMFNLKTNIKEIIFQYVIFFASLGITLLLEVLITRNLNSIILEFLHLSFLNHIQFLSILIFLILFLSLNIVLKIINKANIEYVEAFLAKETLMNKILKKGLKYLKRIVKK
jgi:O-antigen/teichoic acid export membrane protein